MDHWDIAGGNLKWYSHLETSLTIFIQLNIFSQLSFDPVIALSDIYSRKMKIYVHIKALGKYSEMQIQQVNG